MADKTGIEWTDATWNPVTGCTKVTPGCTNCYAETFAERWRGIPGHYFEQGFDVVLRPDKLDQPLRWTKPRRIFVNSMSDLFHDEVPDEFIADVFAVMACTPHHTYQLLTKRHGRMRSLLTSHRWWTLFAIKFVERRPAGLSPVSYDANGPHLRNLHLGVSVEDQKRADLRIPALLDTPAAVRWLSMEPLLGPVDLTSCGWAPPSRQGFAGVHNPLTGEWWPAVGDFAEEYRDRLTDLPRLDWVVVGGESGPGARPMHPAWARSLRDQCQAADVPYLFKQWGEYGPLPKVLGDGRYANDRGVTVANDGTVYQPGDLAWPDGPRVGEALRAKHDKADLHAMYRVGKKAAGRELDGRTWDEYPAGPEAAPA